jgi:hypothetical protein
LTGNALLPRILSSSLPHAKRNRVFLRMGCLATICGLPALWKFQIPLIPFILLAAELSMYINNLRVVM